MSLMDPENSDSGEENAVQFRRKALLAVVEQCQRALASDSDDHDNTSCGKGVKQKDENRRGLSSPYLDPDIYEMILNQTEGPEFVQKIDDIAQAPIQIIMSEEDSSWEIVTKNDLWEDEDGGSEHKDYLLVKQEDVADGMACFMTAYLLSLKETKDLSPNQLQEALRKTFSVKKRKGKLRKAWDGTQVIYNVASWSATALGNGMEKLARDVKFIDLIYQNPAVLGAASTAFWTSCQAMSKFF